MGVVIINPPGAGGGGGSGTVSASRWDGDEYIEDSDLRLFIGPEDPKTSTGGRDQEGDVWIDGAPDPEPPVKAYVWDDDDEAYVEDTDFALFIGPESPVTADGGRDQPGDVWLPLGAEEDETVYPGQIIGTRTYDPASEVSTTTTSTTYAAVDAVNLAVTFVVPASGNVLVRLSAGANVASGVGLGWGVHDGTTLLSAFRTQTDNDSRMTHDHLLSGLTPGVTMTLTWFHARITGASTAATTYGGLTTPGMTGNRRGPAMMIVQAL